MVKFNLLGTIENICYILNILNTNSVTHELGKNGRKAKLNRPKRRKTPKNFLTVHS